MLVAMRAILPIGLLVLAGCSSPSRLDIPLYGNYEGHDSIVAAVVPEPDLIPEGIAFDPQTGTRYLAIPISRYPP